MAEEKVAQPTEHNRQTTPGQALLKAGLDLVHPFDVSDYNTLIKAHPQLNPLPMFGREQAMGLLIGNSRALWPIFLNALTLNQELAASSHPLDTYVTQAVSQAVDELNERHVIRFSHVGGAHLVSMLHVAEASGFAERGPVHLAIHPTYGPWFALRAVVILDRPAPGQGDSAPSLCSGCSAPCKSAFAHAESGTDWRDWVGVRDACPVGRDHRYSEDQIRYHYIKDRAALGLTSTGEGDPT
jgi:methylmalonic aciduria homocystinuria type C protein